MILRICAIFCLLVALGAGPALAHEGHAHKVMGTIAAVQDRALDVKSTSGEASRVVLTDKTRITRSGSAVQATDLKAGDRVVVTYEESKGSDGKPVLTATDVRVGTRQ
jgi:hypothetical protein